MVASSNSNSNEWVAFTNHQGSSGFEAIVPPSTTATRRGNRVKKGESSSSQKRISKSQNGSASNIGNTDGNHTVATWMKQPIDSDASWAPLAPPPNGTATKKSESRPTIANKKSLSRTRSASAALEPPPGKGSSSASSRRSKSRPTQNLNGPNPVSSDSSSSSEIPSRRPRQPSRGRSSDRVTTQQGPLPTNTNISSSSRRGRSRTRNSITENNSSQGPPSPPVHQPPVPLVSNRGRSSSRTRSSVTATPTRDRSTSISRRNSVTAVTGTTAILTTNTRSSSKSRPPATSSTSVRRARSTSRTAVTRSRSISRTRTSKPPPSTSRTRREMRTTTNVSSSASTSNSAVGAGGTGVVQRRPSVSSRSVNTGVDNNGPGDVNIGRDISFGKTQASTSTRSVTPKRSALMEKLFGDQVTEEAKQSYLPRSEPSPTGSVSSFVSWQQPERIHSRILLTATVYHNTATNLWIATINTNQKGVAKNPATASKYLKAFSFSSEKEARESAIANAPPKMMKFGDNANCFICQGKFAMFRRACHCRNCGVCICSACSTTWSSKMIPETYNLKKESQVKICKTCHFLCGAFKKALLDGDYEEAIALYGSGNINLRTPFPQISKKKEETMYPIHCAVEGGNLDIVRWLMEDHFCPIKFLRTGSGKRAKKGGSPDFPILTSKNRSVLTIAMESLQVEILRYLVVDNSVSVYEAKDMKASLRALEAVLLALPQSLGEFQGDNFVHRWDDAVFDGEQTSVASSLGADQTFLDEEGTTRSKGSKRHGSDSCIICYDNAIDCVITPCGHQICCLVCSKNLSACPVCNNRGEFIKIFRP